MIEIHHSILKLAEKNQIKISASANGGKVSRYIAEDLTIKGNLSIQTDPKSAIELVLKQRGMKVASSKPVQKKSATRAAVVRRTAQDEIDGLLAATHLGLNNAKKALKRLTRAVIDEGKSDTYFVYENDASQGEFRLYPSDVQGWTKMEVPVSEIKDSKSIVKPGYKAKYSAGGVAHNGDELAQAMANYVSPNGQADMRKLQIVAEANGIDTEKYDHLNPGQIRMNVGNILRAKIRKGEKVLIGTTMIG